MFLAGGKQPWSFGAHQRGSQASSAVEQSDGERTPTQLNLAQNSGRSEATTEVNARL